MTEISREIGTEREAGKLLKTGQTTQYGGYEDDGYFQKGLSKQYDVLTTGRYVGTTDITLNDKTDSHSNNCVYDKRTKLMWSRYIPGSVGPASNGRLPWTTNVNGEGIFAFVAAANAALLSGYDDWRVPNVVELASLLNMEAPLASPDATAFPSWTLTPIWASTTLPDVTTQAMRVGFDHGHISYTDKTTNTFFGILVRGG